MTQADLKPCELLENPNVLVKHIVGNQQPSHNELWKVQRLSKA